MTLKSVTSTEKSCYTVADKTCASFAIFARGQGFKEEEEEEEEESKKRELALYLVTLCVAPPKTEPSSFRLG